MSDYEELQAKIVPILLPYARRIGLFGSVVRGEEKPESDIDILVALKPPSERPPLGLAWFGLEEELSHILDRTVDLVSEEELSSYIRPRVDKELVILYDEG